MIILKTVIHIYFIIFLISTIIYLAYDIATSNTIERSNEDE